MESLYTEYWNMKIIGHRGAKGLAPENTAASVRAALDAAVDMIEIDVRVTSDGIPVLVHNDSLPSLKGRAQLRISRHSFDELCAARPDLAQLAEIIELIDGAVPLMVEVKSGEPAEPIRQVLQRSLDAGAEPANIWIGSKDFRLLKQLHGALPALPCVVIEPWSGVRASHRARQLGTRYLAMNARWLWPGFIRAVSRNFELYAYTINDPAKAGAFGRAGLAGIFTDMPQLFRGTGKDAS